MMAAQRWSAFGASVRGASHVASGAPNQDAYACWLAKGRFGPPAIAAVADGHGGAFHFRSSDGARIAVDVTVSLLREVAERDADTSSLPERILSSWNSRVQADLAARPFTEREWLDLEGREGRAAISEVRGNPRYAYGTTLLAALVTREQVFLLQVGDGDILCVLPDGRTIRPLPGDARLRNGWTTSLCRREAVKDFRLGKIVPPATLPATILLATDGCANSFNTDADFLRLGSELVDTLRKHGPKTLERELSTFLTRASEEGSRDDVTVALLYPDPRDVASTRTPQSETDAAESVAHETRRSQLVVIFIGVIVLLTSALLWVFKDRSSADSPPVSPSIEQPNVSNAPIVERSDNKRTPSKPLLNRQSPPP